MLYTFAIGIICFLVAGGIQEDEMSSDAFDHIIARTKGLQLLKLHLILETCVETIKGYVVPDWRDNKGTH